MSKSISALLGIICCSMILNGSAHAGSVPRPDWHIESNPEGAYTIILNKDRQSGLIKSISEIGTKKPSAQLARLFKADELRGKRVDLTIIVKFNSDPEDFKLFLNSFSSNSKNNVYQNVIGNRKIRKKIWETFETSLTVPQDSHSVVLNFLVSDAVDIEFKNVSLSFAQSTPLPASVPAKAYFDHAIQIIRTHHIDTKSADWESILAKANLQLIGSQKSTDTYPAIRNVLAALGNKHSFLRPPSSPSTQSSRLSEATLPSWNLLNRRFGQIRLPGLLANYDEQSLTNMKRYVGVVTSGLTEMDKADLCGWVVDLRSNDGGNMWPMLVGLVPLLDNKPYGYFITNAGEAVPWTRDTVVATEKRIFGEARWSFVLLNHGHQPLAVLIGPKTGSSGEIIALSLKSQKNAKLFGSPTFGLTSGNEIFQLSDGAQLVLTSSYIRDTKGNHYRNEPIAPDEHVNDNEVENVAVSWLRSNCDVDVGNN